MPKIRYYKAYRLKKKKLKNVIYCRTCGKAISGRTFLSRMKRIRRHYKTSHPKIWRRSILRAVRKRKRK